MFIISSLFFYYLPVDFEEVDSFVSQNDHADWKRQIIETEKA